MNTINIDATNTEATWCVADIQMDNIFLVQEEGAEVDATGCQNSLVGFKVHTIHNKGAVTQQALFPLPVKLLQNLPTVPWEIHRSEDCWISCKAGTRSENKCHIREDSHGQQLIK